MSQNIAVALQYQHEKGAPPNSLSPLASFSLLSISALCGVVDI